MFRVSLALLTLAGSLVAQSGSRDTSVSPQPAMSTDVVPPADSVSPPASVPVASLAAIPTLKTPGKSAATENNTSDIASTPLEPVEGVRRLRLYHTHSNQHIDIVYSEGGQYIPEALDQLNHFLRDSRNGEENEFDPRLFDLLTDLTASLGRPDVEITVLCGYRTPETNAYLRRRSRRVARHSLHMEAMAMDIRVPGVTARQLRDAALLLHRGGVGYYRRANFVHVDIGPVRRW